VESMTVSNGTECTRYKVAEKDFEYLLRVIDLALAYFADGMEATGQVQ